MLSSCASKSKSTGSPSSPVGTKVVPVADLSRPVPKKAKQTPISAAINVAAAGMANAKIVEMMDLQELEMRTAMAHSEAAVIVRQGEMLLVRLKGDLAFNKGSAAVESGLYGEVERMTTVLNRYQETVIQVGGHTDSQGSDAYNLNLSQRRADAVVNLMMQLGIAQSRIEAAAYGEAQPIASNDSEAGRRMNRRVEIKIAPTSR
ncbi:MAG: OmpA family protein [Desulfobulbaceae bacterium]|nr:OmpA family protein [Desulfobulbaceae bacterium]